MILALEEPRSLDESGSQFVSADDVDEIQVIYAQYKLIVPEAV